MRLREAVNKHCAECTHDSYSPGTRLQQITLCSVNSCALWEVRPKTTSAIPESVLRWYGVKLADSQGLNAIPGGAS